VSIEAAALVVDIAVVAVADIGVTAWAANIEAAAQAVGTEVGIVGSLAQIADTAPDS